MDVKALPGFDQVDRPQREKISTCIHCGLCLDKCPTYRTLGTEMDSPRGRVYLIKAVDEERLGITPTFVEHMYLCLDCRACETACPSHVEFGDLMERARGQIERRVPRALGARLLRRLVFRGLFPRPRMLRGLFRLLRLYQRSGLQRLLRAAGVFGILPARLRDMEAMLPELPPQPFTRSAPEYLPGREPVTRTVGFFAGCVMDGLFVEVHDATARVLQANGCGVRTPRDQACCGALHMHAGDREQAKKLARRNIAVFERQDLDVIVNNAAGCGAQLKSYGELLADDPQFAARAQRFSERVQDVIRVPGAGAAARAAGRRAQAGGVRRPLPPHPRPGRSPAAARPVAADPRAGIGAADRRRLLLRCRRYLQHHPPGHVGPYSGTQDGAHRRGGARRHRHRQPRLHDAAAHRRAPGRARRSGRSPHGTAGRRLRRGGENVVAPSSPAAPPNPP